MMGLEDKTESRRQKKALKRKQGEKERIEITKKKHAEEKTSGNDSFFLKQMINKENLL